MRIVLVASEVAPFAKTGGLADVTGSLPAALARLGHRVSVFMPYYRQVGEWGARVRQVADLMVPLGRSRRRALVMEGRMPGTGPRVPVYFIARGEFFDREHLYGPPGGAYPDNCARFCFFCRAVCEAVRKLELRPDVVHLNDWQTALIAGQMKHLYAGEEQLGGAASVLTLHNLGYQGIFSPWKMPLTGLSPARFNWQEMEFYGQINLLKGGLVYADLLNTVSKRYAREIQTSGGGCGLEGILSARRKTLYGIVNGLDYSVWNPATDRRLPARYSPARMAGKARCRRTLQKEMELDAEAAPALIGMVSRLAEQKGFEILAEAAPKLMKLPVQFALLGSGEERYRRAFTELAARYPGRMAVRVGYDERRAHLIEAGSDIYLMPSRYEPCGLNQLISLKYGTVPVVRETGGLADTVVDGRNGFSFARYTPAALVAAVRRALAARGDRARWRRIVARGMAEDWSWDRSAGEYVRFYELARAERGLPPAEMEAKAAPRRSKKAKPPRRRAAAKKPKPKRRK